MRLGKNQKELLLKMLQNNWVIRHCMDYTDNSRSITLEDFEGDNIYEDIPRRLFESIPGKLLKHSRSFPNLEIEIDEYKLSNFGKQKIVSMSD